MAALLLKSGRSYQDREEVRLCAVFFGQPVSVDDAFLLGHLRGIMEARRPDGQYARWARDRNIALYLQAMYFHALRHCRERTASECADRIHESMHLSGPA